MECADTSKWKHTYCFDFEGPGKLWFLQHWLPEVRLAKGYIQKTAVWFQHSKHGCANVSVHALGGV